MTTRMDKIEALTAELRELYAEDLAEAADREIASVYGCKVEDLDKPDMRLGGWSIREVALRNMERWGEW